MSWAAAVASAPNIFKVVWVHSRAFTVALVHVRRDIVADDTRGKEYLDHARRSGCRSGGSHSRAMKKLHFNERAGMCCLWVTWA